MARQNAARNWDAETARLELFNEGLVEIRTGDPAWDHVFSLAQILAHSLLVGPTPPALPFFVTTASLTSPA
jgi:hypothetical protein